MGVLLFQDLAVIPLLVLIPALALSTGEIAFTIGVALAKAAVVLAIVLFLGQRLMRPLFDGVARLKSSELFVLFVLLVTLGLAWVTGLAGLSLALGAFLAGMLISETEYRYQVEDYIKPFRDVLLGLFFVTIGMLLDPAALAEHWAAVAAVFIALMLVKFAVIYALARAFAAAKPTALRAALALAPAGEFGFVLLALAESAHALDRSTLQVVLAATLLSMLAAPLILQRMDSIVLHLVESEWTQRAVALHTLAVKSMATRGHVIVCGYGRSGQALAQFLEREGIPVIALDSDPERVRQAAAAGDSVVFGDASRREVLIAAALARANALVVSFADTPRALTILAHVRDLRPELPVVVRTFDDSDVGRLRDAGAAEIVAEVVEGSLMLATQTMMQLGIPLNRVLRRLRDAREERYRHMRGFFRGATDEDAADAEQPRLHTVLVGPNAACVGATLARLRLDSFHVQVTAVRRKGTREVNPGPDTKLQADDVVVLLGTPSDIARAEMRLLQG
jgi:CPA2 family monovalent cation:H+ antiporter-2